MRALRFAARRSRAAVAAAAGVVAVCGVAVGGASGQAQPINIVNAGFEEMQNAQGQPIAFPLDTWTNGLGTTTLNTGPTVIVPGWGPDAPESTIAGVQNYPSSFNPQYPGGIAYLFGGGVIEQTLTETLQGNMIYTLTGDIGNTSDVGGYAPVTLDLLAGGTVLTPTTATGETPPEGVFRPFTRVYEIAANDPNVGQPLTVRIAATGGGQGAADNIALTVAPIPEPAALGLLALGGPGLLARRGRRR